MKMIFALFLSSFFGMTAYAHTFIGNGGEGIRLGDQLYLRDLFETSNYKNPYFGYYIDLKFLDLKENSSVAQLNFSRDLLRRKLTDINSIEPLLGYYILRAINQYNWIFTDQPLGLLDDDGPIIDLPANARVQIANRDLGNIRIHRGSWNQLTDASRVALIVHEAVFSLLKPICTSQNSCPVMYQSPRLAREITSALFFSRDRVKALDVRMKQSLSIPQEIAYCPHGKVGLHLQEIKTLKKYSIENGVDAKLREQLFNTACADAGKNNGVGLRVKLYREPFTINTYIYATTYGPQSSVMMKERSWELDTYVQFNGVESCKEELHSLAAGWYEKNQYALDRTSCMTSSYDSPAEQSLIQFNQFSNENEFNYYSESESIALRDFSLKQRNVFALFSKQSTFLVPLYQCRWVKGYFLTTSSRCEGKKDESVLIGYVSRTAINVAERRLYRCLNTQTKASFVSTQEDSCRIPPFQLEGLLGYIP